jgi:hypothetical protein
LPCFEYAVLVQRKPTVGSGEGVESVGRVLSRERNNVWDSGNSRLGLRSNIQGDNGELVQRLLNTRVSEKMASTVEAEKSPRRLGRLLTDFISFHVTSQARSTVTLSVAAA